MQQLFVIASCQDALYRLPAKERTAFWRWIFQLLTAVVQPAAVCHFQLPEYLFQPAC
jgi:hypothetical protein